MTRMMAPYTPFLTEHMFQNLRHLLSWKLSNDNTSIHYIMLPKPRYQLLDWIHGKLDLIEIVFFVFFFGNRPDLIDESIEAAVARMQSVIELGRYIRDVKVMPIKVHMSSWHHNDVIHAYVHVHLHLHVHMLCDVDRLKTAVVLQCYIVKQWAFMYMCTCTSNTAQLRYGLL